MNERHCAQNTIAIISLIGMSLTAGCAPFRALDRALTRRSASLAAREQQLPENVFARQGYFIYEGSSEIPPVQVSTVTNVSRLVSFSYTSQPEIVDPDSIYFEISREFRNVLGEQFHELRQTVYPAGFQRWTNLGKGTMTFTYTFPPHSFEPGKHYYEWRSKYGNNKSRVLMKGNYTHQVEP